MEVVLVGVLKKNKMATKFKALTWIWSRDHFSQKVMNFYNFTEF